MSKPSKRGRGRPRKPAKPGIRNMIGFRVPAELKIRLEKAAEESGRSISQEAEIRLEKTFDSDDAIVETFGGKKSFAIMRLFASAKLHIEEMMDASWETDWDCNQRIKMIWKNLVQEALPQVPLPVQIAKGGSNECTQSAYTSAPRYTG